MFIRPDDSAASATGCEGHEPIFTVINCCDLVNDDWEKHNAAGAELNSEVCVAIDAVKKVQIILGTEYCGEMKKGMFGMMNFWMPMEGIMPMHCSANTEAVGGKSTSALFFGLSGTGKTTLSADPNRILIGDDEHGWDDDGIFNFEGGCYAKTIDLAESKEPEIWRAIKKDALLENVPLKAGVNEHGVDFADTTKTQNGRVAYPLHHIPNHEPTGQGGHPNSCIFLTCDAFGVMPPVSKLSTGQAMYHFISGYTAKVAGTELGVTEPTPTFSACFGAAFLTLHPMRYAALLEQKLQKHDTTAYIVNTGWTTPQKEGGERMDIPITRACITAILDGSIKSSKFRTDPIFGFEVPETLGDIDATILDPKKGWQDKAAFDATALKLAGLFKDNFTKYADYPGAPDFTPFGPQI